MRSRSARIVVVGVVAATTLVACSEGVSKDEFVAAADDLCSAADERIGEMGKPQVEDAVLDYVERAEEIARDLIADLRDLEAPDGDETEVDEVIDGLERATSLLEPLARATIDRDTGGIEDLQQEVEEVTNSVSESAEAYGFEVCGAKVLDPNR